MKFRAEIDVMPLKALLDPQGKDYRKLQMYVSVNI
jgi:hypothetical protein